jgi:serpin B
LLSAKQNCKNNYQELIMLSLLLPSLLGCIEKPPVDPNFPEDCEEIEREAIQDETVLEVVDGNHDFAIELYDLLRTENENVFVSPYSVSTALGMLHLGAQGNTETEMSTLLGVFADDEKQWHQGQGTLVQEFDLGNNCNYQLSVANKAYLQTGYSYQQSFIDDLSNYYDSAIGELDFSADPEAARIHINDWVSENTNEKIPELFPANSIQSNTKLVLTNAIYMNAPWKDSFDPQNTYSGNFTLVDGSSTDVEMMYRADMPYSIGYQDGFRVVEIPYSGEELVFTAIIPDAFDGLDAIEEQLTVERLSEWKSNMYLSEGEVTIPKFEMRYKETLNPILKQLGMLDAFDPSLSDFSGISEETQLTVSLVIHEAWLKVSESGTEAAAATGVTAFDTSAGEYVSLNRPFLFLIEDKLSGSVLFMGKLSDPDQL